MLDHSLALRSPRYRNDDGIFSIFARMEDESVMPKLSYVYTDLTINTRHILKPALKSRLRKWLTSMTKRGVTVMTYIKTSKYGSHRYYSLEDIWDAEPHWEFWEPTLVDDIIRHFPRTPTSLHAFVPNHLVNCFVSFR